MLDRLDKTVLPHSFWKHPEEIQRDANAIASRIRGEYVDLQDRLAAHKESDRARTLLATAVDDVRGALALPRAGDNIVRMTKAGVSKHQFTDVAVDAIARQLGPDVTAESYKPARFFERWHSNIRTLSGIKTIPDPQNPKQWKRYCVGDFIRALPQKFSRYGVSQEPNVVCTTRPRISTGTNMANGDAHPTDSHAPDLTESQRDRVAPLSVPEAAGINVGRLCPLRVGLALAKLSRLSNVPVEVLWVQFARVCAREDENSEALEPADRFLELIESALAQGSAHVAALDGRHPDTPLSGGGVASAIPLDRRGWRVPQPVQVEGSRPSSELPNGRIETFPPPLRGLRAQPPQTLGRLGTIPT